MSLKDSRQEMPQHHVLKTLMALVLKGNNTELPAICHLSPFEILVTNLRVQQSNGKGIRKLGASRKRRLFRNGMKTAHCVDVGILAFCSCWPLLSCSRHNWSVAVDFVIKRSEGLYLYGQAE